MPDPRPQQRAGQPSSDEPEMKSLLQAWQMYNSKDEDAEKEKKPSQEAPPPEKEKLIPPPKPSGPADTDIMEALLDAFEDGVNLGDKRGARRWLERKNYPKIADWVEKMKQDAYYEAVGKFFKSMSDLRGRSHSLLAGIDEQSEVPVDKQLDPPPDSQVDEPAEAPPTEEPPVDAPEAKPQLFDIHSAVMDMYLEGIDITRRSQLIDALDKGGHEAEVETVSGLSLAEFYTFLSDFFKKLAGSLGGEEGADLDVSPDEVPADVALDKPAEEPPVEEPAPQQEDDGFMIEREMKLDLEAQAIAAPEELANELLAILSQNTGDKAAAKKDVNVLLAQIARGQKITSKVLDGLTYQSETPDALKSAIVDVLVKHDVPVDARGEDESDITQLPYSKRNLRRSIKRSVKMFTEAPEELLPREVADAKRMFNSCLEGGIPLAEAAERVAKKLGTEKHMPEKLVKDLEKYLGSIGKAKKNEEDEPVAKKDEPVADPAAAPKDGEEQDEEGDEDEAKKKDAPADEKPPVITGDQAAPTEAPVAPPIAAPAVAPTTPAVPVSPVPSEPTAAMEPASAAEKPEDDEDDDEDEAKKGEDEGKKKDDGEEDEAKKGKDEGKKEEEEDDEEEDEAKKGKKEEEEEDDDEEEDETKKDETNNALGELLRLALAPIGKQWGSSTVESRKSPKAIALLKEDTTGVGVSGARDTGVLDVFSYGGYLERALPYLISASMSRFAEDDKAKFVNIYRKFTETNDITEMTKLAGALADVVEWGDATQEGAELVKNLRFMGDFLNVLRGSVDFSKKAFPAI